MPAYLRLGMFRKACREHMVGNFVVKELRGTRQLLAMIRSCYGLIRVHLDQRSALGDISFVVFDMEPHRLVRPRWLRFLLK
jgi:hypothetical protein